MNTTEKKPSFVADAKRAIREANFDLSALEGEHVEIVEDGMDNPKFELHEKAKKDYKAIQQLQAKVNRENKYQRNYPCPCGSGKKWKKCCIVEQEERIIWDFDNLSPKEFLILFLPLATVIIISFVLSWLLTHLKGG